MNRFKNWSGITRAVLAGLLLGLLAACTTEPLPAVWTPASSGSQPAPGVQGPASTLLPPTRVPGAPIFSPTPDAPHTLPTLRTQTDQYVVQPSDTLGTIAQRYGVSLGSLVSANQISNPNLLEVGQVLVIPPPEPLPPGPDFKVIPDSELVYGPVSATLDLPAFVQQYNGYLKAYSEDLDGHPYSGAEIIQRVSYEYSVSPRLLLAFLEYKSHWLSNPDPQGELRDYPAGYVLTGREGLYLQLAWVANNLNRGYYLWQVGAFSSWILADGSVVPVNPTINAGTAGVQHLASLLYNYTDWQTAVTADGLFATYQQLFGYPFDLAVEPLVPSGLTQPLLHLPIEPGAAWSFTGGPHGGWGSGSGWAALDFAPPGDALGCVTSDAWVIASADGLIVRSADGAVLQDLDGDGFEQTGWTLLYMHIETRDRVPIGTYLHVGDHIGHPSCEGGVSTGTHVHLARKYNGEWISADGFLPFNLDGWVSEGQGVEYDGTLNRNGVVIEAYAGRDAINQIQHD
ncbi:MAG: LysM peptidoglycan-binding domain-containing protein [Chloroflexi bacterium]|nr:LysM peptidoglycan-binding domain-containing protein [Anaerolineaceae bacterium]NMB88222.1 LysM peptidoglycan-binding domain-containing protein [Chloroflexota bacterium]